MEQLPRRANRRMASHVTVCAKLPLLLTPLAYIPVGNAEEGRKDKSFAGIIKFTFLNSKPSRSRLRYNPVIALSFGVTRD